MMIIKINENKLYIYFFFYLLIYCMRNLILPMRGWRPPTPRKRQEGKNKWGKEGRKKYRGTEDETVDDVKQGELTIKCYDCGLGVSYLVPVKVSSRIRTILKRCHKCNRMYHDVNGCRPRGTGTENIKPWRMEGRRLKEVTVRKFSERKGNRVRISSS